MRNSRAMEQILKVARKEHLTVKEATRRHEGSAQCDTRRKGEGGATDSAGELFGLEASS